VVAVLVDLEEGWLDKHLELSIDKLTKLLNDIANHNKVKTAAIKMVRTNNFAKIFGLHNGLKKSI
jgi:hypothetical protein